ncbi:MAG: helix-turn-helix transcriptional regulator [Calditrichaeota bacterium]|nr:helix-turn-helix transcriptional regulator [Calditrichota bacterium]
MLIRDAFATVLRLERQKQNLSQNKLAEMAGISRMYLWRLEQGRQSPTLDVLIALCNALQIDAGKFVGEITKQL